MGGETANLPRARDGKHRIEHCPYCHRPLVEYFAGEPGFTIFPRAAGRAWAEDHDDSPVEYTPGSAYCLRLLCRIRKRIRPL